MQPRIIVAITPQGIEPIEVQANTEGDQAIAEEILNRIRPTLDAIDAVLKRTSTGPRG